MSDEGATALTDALATVQGPSSLDRILRGSMMAVVSGRPEYAQALQDAELRGAAELDLHLAGSGVQDHRTRASFLGDFLTRSADAVKELAKDIGGLARHTPGLLVEAPSPGSVRVVLRTMEPDPRPGEQLPGVAASSLDAMAMHQLVSLLLLAADVEAEDDPLEATVTQLRGNARLAIRQLAQAVLNADWEVEGSLAMQGHRRQPLRLNQEGARRLVAAAQLEGSELDAITLVGEVDGWVWSASTLRFVPTAGKPFVASVPPDLQEAVASIIGSTEHRAQAKFLVTRTFPTGDRNSVRNSFALTAIDPQLAGIDELPFDRSAEASGSS